MDIFWLNPDVCKQVKEIAKISDFRNFDVRVNAHGTNGKPVFREGDNGQKT